jgi:hypothetical protein
MRTPKDRDEVNRREVCECNGWVCDLEVIGTASRLRFIRKSDALARIDETRDLTIEEKAARRKWKNTPIFDCADWTPEAAKKRSASRWGCTNKILINSLWTLPTSSFSDISISLVQCNFPLRSGLEELPKRSWSMRRSRNIGLIVELEHLKIETTLIDEMYSSYIWVVYY